MDLGSLERNAFSYSCLFFFNTLLCFLPRRSSLIVRNYKRLLNCPWATYHSESEEEHISLMEYRCLGSIQNGYELGPEKVIRDGKSAEDLTSM